MKFRRVLVPLLAAPLVLGAATPALAHPHHGASVDASRFESSKPCGLQIAGTGRPGHTYTLTLSYGGQVHVYPVTANADGYLETVTTATGVPHRVKATLRSEGGRWLDSDRTRTRC